MVLADYFEHVLQLPLAYHAGAHSGRQMKVMLTGTDTLWWLWLSFFREHLSAFLFIVLLLPTSLVLNWRLACSIPRPRCGIGRAHSIPATCAAWSNSRPCHFPMTGGSPP